MKGTRELWFLYGGREVDLEGYADADGSMMEDRRAVSGYAFIVNGGAVSWSAKRQEIVSLSTTESEYIAATNAAKEALWLRFLIHQVFGKTLPPTTPFSDNQSAIALAKEHQYHARTKHIDVRFHFIHWIIEEGKICLVYCLTEDMVANVFTKTLPSPKSNTLPSLLDSCQFEGECWNTKCAPSSPNVYTYTLCVHSFYARIFLLLVSSSLLRTSLSMALLALSQAVLALLSLMILAILCPSYYFNKLLLLPFLLSI